jgi:hypothetical protein
VSALEKLDKAIREAIASGEFGEPRDMVTGWVLVVGEQDVDARDLTYGDSYPMLTPDGQSRAFTAGLIDFATVKVSAIMEDVDE